ncbi:hypothetical protein GCM10010430_58840 [Kitasatospora cystarginea]|uniref:Aminoglycoside phosphotransferase domain-containing protein n=1 Tax=Kitasatospora cystarginea TaxID=58350 RepID=A0ABN3ER39_9ACTN
MTDVRYTDVQHIDLPFGPPAGGWTDESALAAVAGALGLSVGDEILDGGSPARVYRAGTASGEALVVKVLVAGDGVVDGHDLTSFRHKLRQIELIRAGAPRLAAHYLPIVHALDGDTWSACTTPYYASEDLAAPLRGPSDGAETFFRRYTAVVRALVLDGYAVHAVPAPAGHLAAITVGRFLRRLPVLRGALPAELLDADRFVVNGVPCDAPRLVLDRLTARHSDRLARMAPVRLMLPAHGDANTRNLLLRELPGTDAEFRIIDPRGATDPWDPVYDLAKTLFSLSVWDPGLRLGFSVRRSGRGEYEVGFRQQVFPGYRAAIHRFLPFLRATDGLAELFEDDPHWLERLLLLHDLHVLAEAPCRLSDPKPKPDVRGANSTPTELALGHYLLGALLINDLDVQLGRPGELDADRHLALVADHLPGG